MPKNKHKLPIPERGDSIIYIYLTDRIKISQYYKKLYVNSKT